MRRAEAQGAADQADRQRAGRGGHAAQRRGCGQPALGAPPTEDTDVRGACSQTRPVPAEAPLPTCCLAGCAVLRDVLVWWLFFNELLMDGNCNLTITLL